MQEQFAIDFTSAKLGRPHQMRFGAYALYAGTKAGQLQDDHLASLEDCGGPLQHGASHTYRCKLDAGAAFARLIFACCAAY